MSQNNSSKEDDLTLSEILSTANNIPVERAFYANPEEAILELQNELLDNVGGGNNQQTFSLDETLKKSESEAFIPVSEIEKYQRVVATGQKKFLTWVGEGEDRKQEMVSVGYEARNVNFFSTPIDQLDKEAADDIRKRIAQNIHYEEQQLGSNDIRTIIKEGSNAIEMAPKMTKEQEYSKFKFTKENLISDNGSPYAMFYINDKPIYSFDLEAAGNNKHIRIGESNDEDRPDPATELCNAVKLETGIHITPDEIMGYLESGYLINS